jgi:hypothetical protein
MKKILLLLSICFISKISSAQAHSPEDAANHVGDSIKICGKIFGGRFFETSNNSPTLLNMGAAYPASPLTVMIPGDVRSKMGYAPEVELKEKNVCVRGKIVLFKDKPQIIIFNASQLEVTK